MYTKAITKRYYTNYKQVKQTDTIR